MTRMLWQAPPALPTAPCALRGPTRARLVCEDTLRVGCFVGVSARMRLAGGSWKGASESRASSRMQISGLHQTRCTLALRHSAAGAPSSASCIACGAGTYSSSAGECGAAVVWNTMQGGSVPRCWVARSCVWWNYDATLTRLFACSLCIGSP